MNNSKTKAEPVQLIVERKRTNCPFTIISTQEEYRVLNECRFALIKNRVCATVYHWSPSAGTITDTITRKTIEMPAWPGVVDWFSRTDGNVIDDPKANHNLPESDYDMKKCPLLKSALFAYDVLPEFVDANGFGHSDYNAARLMKDKRVHYMDTFRSIFIITHTDEIPPELRAYCELLKYPTPDKEWISAIVRQISTTEVVHTSNKKIPKMELSDGDLDKISHELLGLTAMELDEALAIASGRNAAEVIKHPGTKRTFDLDVIREIKADSVRRSGFMQIMHPKGGLELIGGMDELKGELEMARTLLDPKSKDDGIGRPKGWLLVGPGGTGKSQMVKCIGSFLNYQIARLDVGACKGSLLGQSEGNLRRALALADKISPVILFCDEFEKMWGGASSNGSLDGGASSNMLATWLNWMQDDKDENVIVIAACNDVRGMPGPVIRAGRFDDIIYVPLPGPKARLEIFEIHFRSRGWDVNECDIDKSRIVEATKGFSGAEIERAVEKSIKFKVRRAGFGRSVKPNMADMMEAIGKVTPLSRTHNGELRSLDNWAKEVNVLRASSESADFSLESLAIQRGGGESSSARTPGVMDSFSQTTRKIELDAESDQF